MKCRLSILLPCLALATGPAAARPDVAGAEALGAERELAGTLVDGNGRPLDGARALLRYATRLQPDYLRQAEAVAGAEGRFRFSGIPADALDLRVAAHAPGRPLATPSEGVAADPAPGTGLLRLVLEPRGAVRIRFRVPAGLPPAEGAVALDPGGGWIPFAASEALLAGVPEGRSGIRYHSEAYGGGVLFVDLGKGRWLDTAVELARPDWVEGRVLDERGAPVAGALYRPENAFRGMSARTGEDGVFRIRRPRAGILRVLFRDPRFRDTALALGRDAGRLPLELRLDPGAPPIEGRVVPPAGPPGACLIAAHPEARRPAAARSRRPGSGIRRAVPGRDGRFVLRGLDPESYRVRVECPGADLAEVPADPGASLPPLAPGPARTLEVRVAARGGAPVAFPDIRIHGVRPESPESALLADPSREDFSRGDSLGRAALFPRFAGDCHVCASAPGFAPACRLLAAGDTLPALVELEPARALTVRVRAGEADTGVPLPGARVRVRRAGSRESAWSGEADARGEFTAAGLGPGEYIVDAREGGRIPFRGAVDVTGDATLEARLEPGEVLEGSLLDADGRPARGLRVLARPSWPAGPRCPESVAEAAVGPDGAFRLAGLGDCPLTVGVAAVRSRRAPFLPLWRTDGIRPGGAPLAIRLPPVRAWEIAVVSGGLPLPVDAELHVLVPAPEASGEALGHPLGRVSVRGSHALNAYVGVRYVAVARAPGYRERADTVVLAAGDEPHATRLELPAWPGFEGRIAAPGPGDSAFPRDVRGYAGWTVRGPGGASAAVQPDGAFRLAGLPPGPASFDVRDAGGRLVWSGNGMSGGPAVAVDTGAAKRTLEGLAVDAEGRPLAGVAVVFRRRESREASGRVLSDGLGRFRLELPQGAWLACPEDTALACTRLPSAAAGRPEGAGTPPPEGGTPPDGGAPPIRVRMSAPSRTVTAAFRLPLPLPLRGGAALVGPGGAIPAADPQGGGELPPVAAFFRVPEGRHVLQAVAYAPEPAALWWASEPWEAGAGEVPVPGPGIAVTAADREGRPLRGVGVRFLPRAGDSPRPAPGAGRPWGEAGPWQPPAGVAAGTGAAGTLLCLGVRPGRYWIYASHATHACAPVAWDHARPEAEGTAALVLARGCPIRVKVTHAGHPVAGARVEVYDTLGNRAAPAAFAPRDGELIECGAFPPGRYAVSAEAPGFGRTVRPVSMAEGEEANLETALPAAGWLELIGEGLEDKVFYLKDRGRRVTPLARQAETPPLDAAGAAGGSLLFRGVPPDRYEVWMQGGPRSLGEVEIGPARLTVLDVGRVGKARVSMPARRG